ncbi:hypothetical protein DN752_16565 [Echinicola strongylocentroti]|uniref:Sensor of ECF-type sigma factor n=1 Tax=Echinicola strongylocentroti TaxID=1795355 RepID=A0A2Z4IKY1_9BACT|nr:hypothetical protein [Echinicola strongylocentroti]AWW31605.1 hypothetical protein DN752_16565 [Echinicola strongylocentroti]
MKLYRPFIILASMLMLPFLTQAQITADEEIQLIQDEFGMEKKTLIESYMDLPESDQAAFWHVYQAYEDERKSIARERILIANEYLDNYATLDEEEADNLAKRTLSNSLKLTKLHSKYYKKFKKATSAMDAAKFMQVDDYIHSTIRNAMQEELPFIGEME